MDLQLFIQADSLELIFINNRQSPVRIWDFDNSWGWHTISLQLKRTDSNKKFRLTKLKQIGWTINYPGFIEIPPTEDYKLYLFPREKGWEAEQDISELGHWPLTVKAVLEISETPEAGEFGIFVGKVESAWMRSEPPHGWLFKER